MIIVASQALKYESTCSSACMDTLYRDAKGASPKEFQLIDLIIVASRARKYESTCSSVCMDTLYRDAKGVGPLTCIPLGIENGLSIE